MNDLINNEVVNDFQINQDLFARVKPLQNIFSKLRYLKVMTSSVLSFWLLCPTNELTTSICNVGKVCEIRNMKCVDQNQWWTCFNPFSSYVKVRVLTVLTPFQQGLWSPDLDSRGGKKLEMFWLKSATKIF